MTHPNPARQAELLGSYAEVTKRVRAALGLDPDAEEELRRRVEAVEPAPEGLTRHWAVAGRRPAELVAAQRPGDVVHVSSVLLPGQVLTWSGDVHGIIPLGDPITWRVR